MQSWKPLLAILPTGLLLGLVGGQASRPEMVIHEERPWPQSVRENARETNVWQPAYDNAAADVYARGYSYRPDLDYDIYAWPDQVDRSTVLLAATEYRHAMADAVDAVDAPSVGVEADLPQTRRAVAELARAQAQRVAAEVEQRVDRPSAGRAAEVAAADPRAFVLPPVPPPLTKVSAAPELEGADEADDL